MSAAGDRAAGTRPGAAGAPGTAPGPDRVRTYYGRPVVKEPAWTWEVPWYLWVGGLAGASSLLAAGAQAGGRPELGRAARAVAGLAAAAAPPLLISDLGRPRRFLNMLRVFKPTSAMSVGSWLLAAYAPLATGAAALERLGRLPRLRTLLGAGAGALGAPLATYTGVLIADSAIPAWHGARRELPALFAAGAAASAGAAALLVGDRAAHAPARRLALAGAAGELAAGTVMRRRLGEVGEVYEQGTAGRLEQAARAATAGGGLLLALGRRRPALAAAGALGVLAGSALERWAVFKAGFASARDPRYVVAPQRRRLAARRDATAAAGG